jgi:glyoxylase-like metal-dependent hydrolase (beta-lactamase superfamily II)
MRSISPGRVCAAALSIAAAILAPIASAAEVGKSGGKPAAAPKAASAPAKTGADAAALREPRKVADGVWAAMTKGGANAGWFLFGDSVIAVDSGRSNADAEELLADIAKTTGKKTVGYLVLTSDFEPHVGGAEAFARRGASIVCDEKLAAGFQELMTKAGSRAAVLGVGSRLVLGSGGRHVIVRHLGPADSIGDLALFVVEEKVLFSGDLVESLLLPPLFSKSIDPEGWLDALRLLGNLNPKVLVPGYGLIGPPEGIAATRDYLEHAAAAAQTIVAENIKDDFLPTRLRQPDVQIRNLPAELEPSHEANMRALVAYYRARVAQPAPPPKKP